MHLPDFTVHETQASYKPYLADCFTTDRQGKALNLPLGLVANCPNPRAYCRTRSGQLWWRRCQYSTCIALCRIPRLICTGQVQYIHDVGPAKVLTFYGALLVGLMVPNKACGQCLSLALSETPLLWQDAPKSGMKCQHHASHSDISGDMPLHGRFRAFAASRGT